MVSPRVLVVHPPDGSDRLRAALERAGCTVRHVETASAALATLTTEDVDCLVTERSLPGDDGCELRAAVRQIAPSLPIVLFADGDADAVSTVEFDGDRDSYVDKRADNAVEDVVETVRRVASDEAERSQDISGHEPAPEELVRAIEEAPIGVSLSDPELSDDPLVYVNEQWESFTGYDTDEVLGRNPRLLQGPGTDPETVGELSTALNEESSTTVEVRNYQKDGTPFWNELTIAPIHDENGELAHYVGFQIDVTDRRQAEELATERAEKLSREQQSLQRVLERVNGLLSEVAGVLVEATERQVIEDQVCATVADEPGYGGGWIGRLEGDSLTITASSDEAVASSIPLAELPTAVREGIEADEPRELPAGTDTALDPQVVGADRLLVVPLCYGDRQYGVLGVYGTDSEALDQREKDVLASLGTMIANGLHAVETTRILTTDQVVELRVGISDASFPLSAIAATLETTVEHVGTTRSADGQCEWYVTAPQTGVDASELASLPFVSAVRTVSETDAERTLSVSVETPAFYEQLADHGAVVTGLSATAEGAELTVEAPPEQAVRSLLDALRAQYDGVDLRGRTERDRRDRGRNEFTAEIDEKLTDRQRAALEAAALNDYFEWPRPVDGSEIAETMDITRQTFHQHLRAAERKLVATYLDTGGA
ncbi:PAS domain-containing protein [Halonotius terrestris]|uniref:PAS domain-containing protein n=1 Tax=Halonotius terrestris TaxID=2487750 RepID=A0A8J8PBD3_9EURY|nr:bacterio-opsin activator domain-containing protein [Halonotius terrestris]TQQ83489.1 PAS domain-containing protein [Halonotius terrestris]